jgi:hypothetical protein
MQNSVMHAPQIPSHAFDNLWRQDRFTQPMHLPPLGG